MKAIGLAVLGFIGGLATSAITDVTRVGTLFLGFVGGLAAIVIGDLASEEIRARLDHLPGVLLRLAIRRLPPNLRAERGAEWGAELDHILHRAKIYPVTRLAKGVFFAVGLLFTAPSIARSLALGSRLDSERGLPSRAMYTTALGTLGVANTVLNATALQIIGESKVVLWGLALALSVALLWMAHVAGTEMSEATENPNESVDRRQRRWALLAIGGTMLIFLMTIGWIRAELLQTQGWNGQLLSTYGLQLIVVTAAVAVAYYHRSSRRSITR